MQTSKALATAVASTGYAKIVTSTESLQFPFVATHLKVFASKFKPVTEVVG